MKIGKEIKVKVIGKEVAKELIGQGERQVFFNIFTCLSLFCQFYMRILVLVGLSFENHHCAMTEVFLLNNTLITLYILYFTYLSLCRCFHCCLHYEDFPLIKVPVLKETRGPIKHRV